MGKATKHITSDYLSLKLTKGWTTQDFCNDLGVSEEWFNDFIGKRVSKGYQFYTNFLRDIKENERLAEKKQRNEEKKSSNTSSEETKETVPPQVTVSNKSEEITTPVSSATPSTPKVKVDSTTAEINSLFELIKKKEHVQSDKKAMLEKVTNELDSINEKIPKCEKEIERLQNELETTRKILSISTTRYQVTHNHIISLNKEINDIDSEINDYMTQIRELQKITIHVLKNGEITIDKNVSIPESYISIYQELISNSIVENITVKQVQQLSKAIALFQMLQKDDAYFEFIFEDEPSNGKDSIKIIFELLTEKSET